MVLAKNHKRNKVLPRFLQNIKVLGSSSGRTLNITILVEGSHIMFFLVRDHQNVNVYSRTPKTINRGFGGEHPTYNAFKKGRAPKI